MKGNGRRRNPSRVIFFWDLTPKARRRQHNSGPILYHWSTEQRRLSEMNLMTSKRSPGPLGGQISLARTCDAASFWSKEG